MQTLQSLRDGKLAGSKRLDLSCGLARFPEEIFEFADSLEILKETLFSSFTTASRPVCHILVRLRERGMSVLVVHPSWPGRKFHSRNPR